MNTHGTASITEQLVMLKQITVYVPLPSCSFCLYQDMQCILVVLVLFTHLSGIM